MNIISKRVIVISMLFFCVKVTCFAQVTDSEATSRPKVALVLAGGGAYGLAHIGVIKVLEEMGIPIDIVVGTSMGSIVGGFYAMGYNAQDLQRIVNKADWTDLFLEGAATGNESFSDIKERALYAASLNFDRKGFSMNGGLISGYKILRFVDSLALTVSSPIDFDTLKRRYRAVATDVSNGDRIVLSHGSISDAMRGSMSIPGLFTPYYLDGKYLVDGGIVDNLPIDVAKEMGADIIIAVDLFNETPFDTQSVTRTPISALGRSLDILVRANVLKQLPDANIVITVDVRGFTTSDFNKSKELGLLGEVTARANLRELQKIKNLIEVTPNSTKEKSIEIEAVSPIKKIMIEGSSEKNKIAVRALFMPLIGTVPDTAVMQTLFKELDKTGKYESVRVRRDLSLPEQPFIVTLTDKSTKSHELRLNFLYESTFASAVTGNINLVPSLVFQGLTTKNSRLLVDVELLDAPSFDIRFIQPIGSNVYVSPFYAYKRDFTTRLTTTSIGYQFQTVSQSAGIKLAMDSAPGVEISTGWSYDQINSDTIPEFAESGAVDTASLIHSALLIQKLDSPIFPMSGLAASFNFLLSRQELGSERSFATFETKGSTFLSLGTPFSVALLWNAGTDFSESPHDSNTAPPFYKPDLSGRRMFPGPLKVTEHLGSHIAGAGIEIKHNLNWQNKGIKLPAFILMHAAIGGVIQNPQNTDWATEVFHWNTTLGAGIRVSDAFGIALRGGVQRCTDSTYTPFIALDLGGIGY